LIKTSSVGVSVVGGYSVVVAIVAGGLVVSAHSILIEAKLKFVANKSNKRWHVSFRGQTQIMNGSTAVSGV